MENVNESYLEQKMSLNPTSKKKVHHSLKNGWFVLRYSVLSRITYEIENLLIVSENLKNFVPSGIWTRLLKIVLRSKIICRMLKKIQTICWKKITFDTRFLLRKKTDNKQKLNRHQRKLQRSIQNMSKDELADNLKRAYDIQQFHNNMSNSNFVEKCHTILSEKSK